MKHIKSLYIVLATLLLAACQTEQWENMGGGFLISLGEDVTVTTKSTPAELGKPTTDKFALKIVKESTNNTLYEGAYTSSIIPASAGFYTVTATCGNNPVLALDAPYYKGEQTGVEVTEGTEPTSVSLTCSVANALTSVVYSNTEKFDDLFSSYAVTITAGQQSVAIGKEQAAKSAYYQAGTIPSFQFTGTLKDNGQEVSMPLEDEKLTDPATFAAAKHCKLTLSVKPTASGLILTVEKVEVENVTISETIPVDWLPAPQINGFADGQTSLTYTETDPAIPAQLNFTGSLAIQDVEFSFDFKDPQEQFQALNGKTFLLSQLSEEDRTLLNAAHIILPSLDGEKEGHFDFTAMTNYLQTLSGGADAVNTIRLRIQANNRWSSEEPATYQIVTTKPIFHVSAYPGNIWTKEFTMNSLLEEEVESGDYAKLSENMTYQFSTNGNDWTNFGDDLRKADLTPGTTYYIRGVYRGEIASTSTEIMTYPVIELKNGNLSEYSIVAGQDGSPFNNRGSQFEWTGWATLNELTTPTCSWTAYSYNTRSGTRPVSDVRSDSKDNVAAWIITIGYGYGGTNSSPKSVTPSELYLGTNNTKGIEYASHPTGVKFYYKYTPFDNDNSDIYIQILNDNTVLGEGSLQEKNTITSYVEHTMNITYKDEFRHLSPNKISLVFKSGFNTSVESRESGGLTSSNTANPKFRGSELYIDDISLIYDK